MRTNLKLVFLIAALAISSIAVFANIATIGAGRWPTSWPKELEHLRHRAKTFYVGTGAQETVYQIPFSSREEFESAWPHLLSLKSKGAPIVLQPGPFRFEGIPPEIKAGVLVLWPSQSGPLLPNGNLLPSGPPWPDSIKTANGELPEWVIAEKGRWVTFTGQTNYGFKHRARIDLVLIFDGQVVDTNRIPFPKDAPLVPSRTGLP